MIARLLQRAASLVGLGVVTWLLAFGSNGPAAAQESVCRFLPLGVAGAMVDTGTMIDDGSSCGADLIVGERDGLPAGETSFVGVFRVDITPAVNFRIYYDNVAAQGTPSATGYIGAVTDELISVELSSAEVYIVFCRGEWVGQVFNTYDNSGVGPDTKSIAFQLAADIDARFIAEGAVGCADGTTPSAAGESPVAQPARNGPTERDDGGIPWPPIIIGAAGAAGLGEALRRRRRPGEEDAGPETPTGPRPECDALSATLDDIVRRYADFQQQSERRDNRIARVLAIHDRINRSAAELAAVRRTLGLSYTATTPVLSDGATGVGMALGVTAELLAQHARELAEAAAVQSGRAAPAVLQDAAPAAGRLGNIAGGIAAISGSIGLHYELGRQESLRMLGRHEERLTALYREVSAELTKLTELNLSLATLYEALVQDATKWESQRMQQGCPGAMIDLEALRSLPDTRPPSLGSATAPVRPPPAPVIIRGASTPSDKDLWDYDCSGLEAEIADYHRRLDASRDDIEALERSAREWGTRRDTLEATVFALRKQWIEIVGRLQLAQNDWATFQGAGQTFNWLGWLAGYMGAPWLALALGVSSLGTSVGSDRVAPDDAQRILRGRLEVRFERLGQALRRVRAESARVNNELTRIRRPLQVEYAAIAAKRNRCRLQPGPRGYRGVKFTEARRPPQWSPPADAAAVRSVNEIYISGNDQSKRDQLARVLQEMEQW